jgi:hypothetical protein
MMNISEIPPITHAYNTTGTKRKQMSRVAGDNTRDSTDEARHANVRRKTRVNSVNHQVMLTTCTSINI